MGLEGYDVALDMRDIIRKMVQDELDRQRPRYRIATVVSIDRANRKCTVSFPGDTTNSVVTMGSIQPKTAGQLVRVDGLAGDRYIDDVLGDAYVIGASATLLAPTDQTIGTTTSTSPVSLGARGGSGTFVAPASGSIRVVNNGRIKADSAGNACVVDYEVRTGTTVGSGTIVRAVDSDYSWINFNAQYVSGSVQTIVSGLTPGNDYNIRQMVYATAGTASFRSCWLIINPN